MFLPLKTPFFTVCKAKNADIRQYSFCARLPFSLCCTPNTGNACRDLRSTPRSPSAAVFTLLRTGAVPKQHFSVLHVFRQKNGLFHRLHTPKRRYPAVLFLRTPSFHSMLSAPHRHRLPKPARHDLELFRNRVHVVENRNRPKTAFLGFTCFPAEKRAFSPFASPKAQVSGSTLFARRSIECARMKACAGPGRLARSTPNTRRFVGELSFSAHRRTLRTESFTSLRTK